MLSIIWYLLRRRTSFLFTIPFRASFSTHFLLSQWPSQFLFLFFISSSIILPSPLFLVQLHVLFCLSILHAPSFSISTSQMLPVVFAHSVVVSKSPHHTTLHSTQNTSLESRRSKKVGECFRRAQSEIEIPRAMLPFRHSNLIKYFGMRSWFLAMLQADAESVHVESLPLTVQE